MIQLSCKARFDGLFWEHDLRLRTCAFDLLEMVAFKWYSQGQEGNNDITEKKVPLR